MNATQLRRIGIAVAVLLAAWGVSEFWSRRQDTVTGAWRLPTVAASAIDTVTILHGADTVVLARTPGEPWTVNGFAAASGTVDDLFGALKDTAPPELVAESPSSFSRMGVDSAAAWLVRLGSHGTPVLRLFVGGRGPGFDASYVRVPGDAHVYVLEGQLGSVVERGVDAWRDKTIAAVPPESVATVEIERARSHVTLARRGSQWTLGGGRAADSAAVARLLERFHSLTASGFATARETDSLHFERARRRVTLQDAKGHELLALALDSGAANFWVRRASTGTVYRLDFWQADQITPAAGALASSAPPPARVPAAPPPPKRLAPGASPAPAAHPAHP